MLSYGIVSLKMNNTEFVVFCCHGNREPWIPKHVGNDSMTGILLEASISRSNSLDIVPGIHTIMFSVWSSSFRLRPVLT